MADQRWVRIWVRIFFSSELPLIKMRQPLKQRRIVLIRGSPLSIPAQHGVCEPLLLYALCRTGALSFPKSLDELRSLLITLKVLKEEHLYGVVGLFSAAYLYKQTFAIPGSVFLVMLVIRDCTQDFFIIKFQLIVFLMASGGSKFIPY